MIGSKKTSVSVHTDFQKLVYMFTMISKYWCPLTTNGSQLKFNWSIKSVYTDLIDQFMFQWTQGFENHCEQIYQFLKISVNKYTDFQNLVCTEMKSVYTDLID